MKRAMGMLTGAAALVLGWTLPASGQPIKASVPDWFWAVQDTVTPAQMAQLRDPATPSEAAPAVRLPQARRASLLRRLPATLQGLRVSGETGEIETAIFLTEKQATAANAQFHLAYLSALSVLPEGSTVVVTINGRSVGATPIRSPGRPDAIDFAIPAGLLVHGFNAVRISVIQRHRADCSIGATYELWTDIDRLQTGIVVQGKDGLDAIGSLEDLPAAGARMDGAIPVRIVLAGKLSPDLTEQLITTVQRIALLIRAQSVIVEFGPMADGTDGINLVVGARNELPRLLGDVAPPDAMTGNVWFAPESAERRPTLVVTGASAAEIGESLVKLRQIPDGRTAVGSVAGLEAMGRMAGHFATGDKQQLSLESVGLIEAPFSGRFYRFEFPLVMPADFVPVDYDRVALDLAGRYGSGLTRDAEIEIEVNGNSVATSKLPQGNGGAFELNQILFPLSRLKPGANTLSVTAQLPRASDLGCENNDAIAGDMRIALSGKSRIILPNIARIGRTPDLAFALNSGIAVSSASPRPTLYVPAPEPQAMSAAFTLATKLAVAQKRIIDFRFTVAAPTAQDGNVVAVAPANLLNPVMMRSIGMDPDMIRNAWDELASRPTGPGLHSIPEPAIAGLPPPVDHTGSIPTASLRNWSAGKWFNALRTATAGGSDRDAQQLLVDGSTMLLVAEGQDADTSSEWTVVTAANASLLKQSTEAMVAPLYWQQLRGRQASIDAKGIVRSIQAEKVRYLATADLSFTNARLVLASWLSINWVTYVFVMLLLAGLLGGATSVLLRNVGRRQA